MSQPDHAEGSPDSPVRPDLRIASIGLRAFITNLQTRAYVAQVEGDLDAVDFSDLRILPFQMEHIARLDGDQFRDLFQRIFSPITADKKILEKLIEHLINVLPEPAHASLRNILKGELDLSSQSISPAQHQDIADTTHGTHGEIQGLLDPNRIALTTKLPGGAKFFADLELALKRLDPGGTYKLSESMLGAPQNLIGRELVAMPRSSIRYTMTKVGDFEGMKARIENGEILMTDRKTQEVFWVPRKFLIQITGIKKTSR